MSLLFGFCCRASDYRSGMQAFPVTRLFFLTDVLPWLGKGCTWAGSKSHRSEERRWQKNRAAMTASKRRRKQSQGLVSFGRSSLVSCRERVWGPYQKCSHSASQSPWTRSEKGSKVLLRRKQTTKCCDEAWLKLHRCSGTFTEHLRPNHSLYNPSLYEECSEKHTLSRSLGKVRTDFISLNTNLNDFSFSV